MPTSIIEKPLTACELPGRWCGCCLSSSVIIRQCGWSRASTTFLNPRGPCDPVRPALHPQHQQELWLYQLHNYADWSYVLAFIPLLAAEEDAHKDIFSICLPCAWNSASGYSKCSFHFTIKFENREKLLDKNLRARLWICENTQLCEISAGRKQIKFLSWHTTFFKIWKLDINWLYHDVQNRCVLFPWSSQLTNYSPPNFDVQNRCVLFPWYFQLTRNF